MNTTQARSIVNASKKLSPSQQLTEINMQLTQSQLREIVDGAERMADAVEHGREPKYPFSEDVSPDDILCREMKTCLPSAWGQFATVMRAHLR